MSARDLAHAIQTLSVCEQRELFTLLARDDAAFRDYIEDVIDAATIQNALNSEQERIPWETARRELDVLHGISQ